MTARKHNIAFSLADVDAKTQRIFGDLIFSTEFSEESYIHPDFRCGWDVLEDCDETRNPRSSQSSVDFDCFVVHQQVADKLENVIDDYIAISSRDDLEGWSIYIFCKPTHPNLTRICKGELSAEWEAVRIRILEGAVEDVRVLFATDREDAPKLYRDLSHGDDDTCSVDSTSDPEEWENKTIFADIDYPFDVQQIREMYELLTKPHIALMVSDVDRRLDTWTIQLANNWCVDLRKSDKMPNKKLFVLRGPMELRDRQLSLITAQLNPNPFKYCWSKIDRTFDFSGGKCKQMWSVRAWLRMPFKQEYLIDTMLWIRTFDVPPYVALWIIDWLPNKYKWSHHFKIKILQNTYDCITRVYERREEKRAMARTE